MSWRSEHESGHAPQIARVAHHSRRRRANSRPRYRKTYDASDVLRLVLDERLKLSIQLPAKTTARCRKLGEDAPDAPWTRRTIDGVWDVPMVGRGRSQIENDYQWQRARTICTERCPSRRFGRAGTIFVCQVPPDRTGSPVSRRRPESEFPQGSVLGVRRPALEAFIRQHVPVQAPTG